MNFENINRYQLGNFMYKFVNNLLPESFSNYFTKVVEKHGIVQGLLLVICMSYMHALIIVDFLFVVMVQKFGMQYQ